MCLAAQVRPWPDSFSVFALFSSQRKSRWRSLPFPLDFTLLGLSLPLYPPYPSTPLLTAQSGRAQRRMWRSVSSSAVLSLSRSIKRRRTHAGRLKSPPTLPYGWWAGRCSNQTAPSRQEEHPSHLLLYHCHWSPSQPRGSFQLSFVPSYQTLCKQSWLFTWLFTWLSVQGILQPFLWDLLFRFGIN